jgi:hypothetical protein
MIAVQERKFTILLVIVIADVFFLIALGFSNAAMGT